MDNQEVGMRLAMIGSMNDEVLNTEELALDVIKYTLKAYPGLLNERFDADEELEPIQVMEEIGSKRGCLKRGGVIDYEKTAGIVLDDFRSGKLGRITLESPEAFNE